MVMDDRKKKILLAIIHDYISTAEPVGSRTISKKYKLGVSPATVRNDMADLEELGFIEQPHTSAGRIPSDLGYRYYVDYLMEKEQLTERQQQLINESYSSKSQEIGRIIYRTGQLLTRLTNYPSMVMAPQVADYTIKYVQLVSMSPTQAMVIVVLDTGAVQHQMIEVAENITQADLEQISSVLNAKLSGVNPEHIKMTIMKEIYFELSKYRYFLDVALGPLENLRGETKDKIYLGGVYNILNQPEFHNIEKLKTLLSLLEKEQLLQEILTDSSSDSDVSVRIGVENSYDQIKDCTMVTATYHMGDRLVGTLGVLGPTRMEYAKVISVVEHLANILNQTMSKINRV
ncbi:heat-inducible transcriptional repressor HrcA [Desulfofalx alkaliphila]|uniref:heat-inducible transcriptional repressor HrcA n=1 Tax=Desulfofalx alkaliphila TaxID=105483 RepID=UPI0004E10F85|nr:heat-inducible transcriptional repressor HrcA [Desulfofalx alkaliphila]